MLPLQAAFLYYNFMFTVLVLEISYLHSLVVARLCRSVIPVRKDGSAVRYVGTIQYASIFAKKYCTLVRYVFFVMVRWYGTLQKLN